eukprot:CAMPEP_0168481028 /NCGR_PEP_ID=MMETSP0228-20121227/64300_1 /TAXON_ID=133427 /ORGANISM="Protoceratium reticulatum, Strain CCCM 535 (=CCMP 1889)" /LENGTH=36 /DNA_ID= /DNA_START= /DNA_END= /DNA_ORIENTATION=
MSFGTRRRPSTDLKFETKILRFSGGPSDTSVPRRRS